MYHFSYLLFVTIFLTVALTAISFITEYKKSRAVRPTAGTKFRQVRTVAVLIASKNGEKTIAAAVAAARKTRCAVFVVSDGSTDHTAKIARQAGATVLALRKNVGKPRALHRAYRYFALGARYDAIAILDDDVLIEKDFIRHAKLAMDGNCAIAVGHNVTNWPHAQRWNMWVASRAYSYWSYQLTLRSIQSAYNVMTCISGSNSLYRTPVLDHVLVKQTPYIVDDTYWTLETHRLQLGTIHYAPKARAWLQDPTNFKDWYKQNLRWMWGTFQGILGHRIGTRFNRFHISYLLLMVDWAVYILSGPLTVFVIWQAGVRHLPFALALLCLGYAVWAVAAAIALRRPRLLLFLPAIIVTDFLFRWIMIHGLVKALRQRTVASCVWESPARFETKLSSAKA